MDKEKDLVDNERLIYTAEGTNDNLYLTNKRVIHTSKKRFLSRNKFFKDVDYRHISSIEYGIISHIWLIILGLVISIVGFYMLTTAKTGGYVDFSYFLGIILIGIGIIIVILYFIYQKSSIIFITENEKVVFKFSGSDAEKMAKEVTTIIRENV